MKPPCNNWPRGGRRNFRARGNGPKYVDALYKPIMRTPIASEVYASSDDEDVFQQALKGKCVSDSDSGENVPVGPGPPLRTSNMGKEIMPREGEVNAQSAASSPADEAERVAAEQQQACEEEADRLAPPRHNRYFWHDERAAEDLGSNHENGGGGLYSNWDEDSTQNPAGRHGPPHGGRCHYDYQSGEIDQRPWDHDKYNEQAESRPYRGRRRGRPHRRGGNRVYNRGGRLHNAPI